MKTYAGHRGDVPKVTRSNHEAGMGVKWKCKKRSLKMPKAYQSEGEKRRSRHAERRHRKRRNPEQDYPQNLIPQSAGPKEEGGEQDRKKPEPRRNNTLRKHSFEDC
jgi:hypothetical protein